MWPKFELDFCYTTWILIFGSFQNSEQSRPFVAGPYRRVKIRLVENGPLSVCYVWNSETISAFPRFRRLRVLYEARYESRELRKRWKPRKRLFSEGQCFPCFLWLPTFISRLPHFLHPRPAPRADAEGSVKQNFAGWRRDLHKNLKLTSEFTQNSSNFFEVSLGFAD